MDGEVSKAKEQKKLNSLFVLACTRGYLDDVKGLLEKGALVTAVDKRSVSALHYACGQGRLEVVKYLWSRGIETDCEDPAGNLPLHYAVSYGHTAVLQFLLGKGAWVEGSNERDDTVLHIAARSGQSNAVQLLLEHGGRASLRDFNKRGLTPLGEAVLGGHKDVASMLLRAGSTINTAAQGWPVLHLAVSLRNFAAVDYLLNAGCNVNEACSSDASTALHCAACAGDLVIAQRLLQNGADPALADLSGKQASEYVATSVPQLRKLLETKLPPKTPLIPPKAPLPGLTNDSEEFENLDAQGRLVRVNKWADIEDPKQLDRASLEFPLELKNQITELRKLRQITAIQEAIVELLGDRDFQKLALDPKAKPIIEEVHQDRDAFKKFLDNKPAMELLRSLQRFQGVVRANGGHNVPFQSLLRDAEPDYQAKSQLRLKGMKMMLEARQRAAIAAALAKNEVEAKQRAEEEMKPEKYRQAQKDDKERSGTSGEGSKGPAQTPGKSSAPRAKRSLESLIEDLPPQEPWSWKKFWKEMRRAFIQSTMMFAVAIIVLKLVTGNYPWQLADDRAQTPITNTQASSSTPISADDYEF